MLGTPRDNAVPVHLSAGRRQCEHAPEGAERLGLVGEIVCGRPQLEEIEGLGRVLPIGGRCDVLGAINNGPATNSEHEVGLLLVGEGNGLHAGVVVGIGLNAAKLANNTVLDLGHHLVVDAVTLDGTPAVDKHDALVVLGEIPKLGDGAFAENGVGGNTVGEVDHLGIEQKWTL